MRSELCPIALVAALGCLACSSSRAPELVPGQELEGEATYYAADGTGNCSFAPTPDDLRVVALNNDDYRGSQLCGGCLEVNGPQGQVVVRVVDRCPGCGKHSLDLSQQAFAEIADLVDGRVPVRWSLTPCPITGPFIFHFKDGSNRWWLGVQLRNLRHPLRMLEIKRDGNYERLERKSYNYFVGSNLGGGPFDFRLTSINDETIEQLAIPFAPNTEQPGSSQFK